MSSSTSCGMQVPLAALFSLVLAMGPGCSDASTSATDGAAAPDSSKQDRGVKVDGRLDGKATDGKVAKPDAKLSKPDAKLSKPDGKVVQPDSKVAKPDSKTPAPDSKTPKPDVVVVKPDTSTTGCGPAVVPYSGMLCGPASKPCKLQRNELLPTPVNLRTYGPSIALDAKGQPNLLFNNNVSGFNGFFGRRSAAGQWQVTPAPGVLASAALEAAPGGDLYGLLHAGNTAGGTLYRYNGSAWTLVEQVTGSQAGFSKAIAGWPGGMAIDAKGCLHTMVKDLYNAEAYLRRDGASGKWTVGAMAKQGPGDHPLVLSPGGQPHIAYWGSATGGWYLHLERPPLPVEQVAPYGSSMLSEGIIVMAVAGGAGKPDAPHIFYQRSPAGSSGTGSEVVMAARSSAGWTVTSIIVDGKSPCTGPCVVGNTCSYDYSVYWPLAAVASGGGDVRLLFARRRYHGTITAVPDPTNPYSNCKWQGGSITGYLMVAWPAGGAVQTATVAQGVAAMQKTGVEAELDASGNLHLGLYTYPAGSYTTTEVRYLMLGP